MRGDEGRQERGASDNVSTQGSLFGEAGSASRVLQLDEQELARDIEQLRNASRCLDETRSRLADLITRHQVPKASRGLPPIAEKQVRPTSGFAKRDYSARELDEPVYTVSASLHPLIYFALKRAKEAEPTYGDSWAALGPRSLLELCESKVRRAVKAHDRRDYKQWLDSLVDMVNYAEECVRRIS